MKYYLDNPTFTNHRVEIDNLQAVKQITAYINKPIILGDQIILSVSKIVIKLILISKDAEIAVFKQV